MFNIIALITLLFYLFSHIDGSCDYYENYNLLGTMKNTSVQTQICSSDDVTCTYVTLSIPGLVVGSFSGCPGMTNFILTTIVASRFDILNKFKAIINNQTNIIDQDLLCHRSMDGTHRDLIDTMSGTGQFFVRCYTQGETYNNPSVQFHPPTRDVVPVKCNNFQDHAICTEGYCGMLEVSSITPGGYSQVSQRYQYCPNDIINQLYLISTELNITFGNALIDATHDIGSICVNKSNQKVLYKNGLSSYFWYVNCYVPSNTNSVQFPDIPNLMFYATTTTTSNPIMTTTKLATPSSNLQIYTIILLMIFSYIFKV
uniref:CUB domain-containing protein n=1 Tax=Strongyloides venezuelensis TaxID=75913 RepID=A0A0K0FXA3_STRVS